ncbi:hypothetical protein B0H15DRAFT_766897 [Mycena belliarum]|uniref:DUF6534 domain-containing protein n=1 Tax=Mycena belliarum TaxID=1033014 RepID=A0AAD6UNL8_9AGAR|nr:hypothetical protein B0H15DRAFT_766897 [Mycena belliae]
MRYGQGVYLIGILLNTFLYGLVLAQFLQYFQTKSDDPLWIRAVVWALLFTDTIHSAVEIYGAWEMGVSNFGNLTSFATVSWIIPFTAVATSVVAIITQSFLAYRVLCLTGSKVLVGVICLSSVLGLVFGCIAGVASGIIKQVAHFGPIVPYVVLWLAFQSITDFLITVSLIAVLARWRTGSRTMETIINRLIRGALETGTFASAFALADLFSFVFFRETNLYAMFAFPIGRIYTNTLLHTLNARAGLRHTASCIDCNSDARRPFFTLCRLLTSIQRNATTIPLEEHFRRNLSGDIEMARELAASQSDRSKSDRR